MSGDKIDIPEFQIQVDKNGMPILGTGSNMLQKGNMNNTQINDDDIASDEEIEKVLNAEPIGKSKLSKDGLLNTKHVQVENVQTKTQINVDNIEDAALNHLISVAEKSTQKLIIHVDIEGIDKGLFDILKKSYKDKSDKILDIILKPNEDTVKNSIKENLKKHYEGESEETN
jgi:hypothetical protein